MRFIKAHIRQMLIKYGIAKADINLVQMSNREAKTQRKITMEIKHSQTNLKTNMMHLSKR